MDGNIMYDLWYSISAKLFFVAIHFLRAKCFPVGSAATATNIVQISFLLLTFLVQMFYFIVYGSYLAVLYDDRIFFV